MSDTAKSDSKSGAKNPPAASAEKDQGYLVLARKYRPADFSDLIGQDAMVQTLRNGFQSNRIAQGYMLSGVRGVGKTTTARILARALNFETDKISEPTIDMQEEGRHCAAIMAGTHVDVIEMDAASHTGIDDIREIIEAARYKPVSARYKVYIIDEVHMLSKSAFNGLLKTLEEPPAHVKFIFATTELRKVPVTVLSRCQRFDLRRIDIRELEQHFTSIAEKESVSIDQDAVSLIARAAEGSVRDGLSLLDQAFARAESGAISADDIRAMLGIADQAEILRLLGELFSGDAPAALTTFTTFYDHGGDPQQLIGDMAEAVHSLTKAKALGNKAAEDVPEAARTQIEEMSSKLSMAILNRAWQALLKGYQEVGSAPNQLSAAEMVLLRLLYMSDLPSPEDIIRALHKMKDQTIEPAAPATGQEPGGGRVENATAHISNSPAARTVNGRDHIAAPEAESMTRPEPITHSQAEPQTAAELRSFHDVVALIGQERDVKLKLQLEDYAELVSFAPGRIELHLLPGANEGLASELSNKLTRLTGSRWMVALSHEKGRETIGSQRRKQEAQEMEQIRAHPFLEQTLAHFPGAEIIGIKSLEEGGPTAGKPALEREQPEDEDPNER